MTRTLSSEEYQELGRRYYRHNQYEKAVEAFTNGIEAANNPTPSLYDHRAASYDKLADFNSALKDGREMIKLNKKDIKGYLRTGSVLQKMDKPDTAIGIYKYGMKHVPVDDKDWKILQQLHDKLTRQLSPAKAVDPFTVLPVELVEMVIVHLTYRNMVNCLRVCKGWKNYLTKCPNLWTHLDLSGARKDVSRTFVRNAVMYSGNQLSSATIHRFRHPDMLRNIATVCKNLTSVEFLSGSLMSGTIIEMSQCAFNLRRLILHTDVGLDTVTQILRFRPTLEHAEFTSLLAEGSASGWKGPFPNLKVFVLTKSPGRYAQHSFDNLSPLFSQTPSLQAITLKGWVSLRLVQFSFAGLPLTHLDLQEFDFGPGQPPPRLPQTLEHLSIQTVYSLYLPSAPAAPNNTILFSGARAMWYFAQSTRLPNLKYLALSSTHNLNPVFLHALLDMKLNEQEEFVHDESAAKVPLEHLCFSKCLLDRELKSIFGEDGLLTASSRIVTRSLLSLDLSGLPVTDDDIEHLLAHPTPPTSLTTLNLTSTHITGAGVKMLVDNFSSLKALTLDHCTRISSRDIVRYAESKGVKVSMKMEEAKGSARKVRYA